MSRRLPMTAVDYVAVALAPALIMVLVASLVFALVTFGYGGEYPERLIFCLAMFVLGSVCIARISIEISSEHAAIYALAFAGVVGYALTRFGGGPWWMSLGLMAVVWYCAHQLTWDCTIVDDTVDASGEGLLQTAGIEGARPVAAQPTKSGKQPKRGSRAARLARKAVTSRPRADEGTTSRGERPTWRERWKAARERPHAHGLWVVYFSLAALPIFGLGQLAIPAREIGSRRTVFTLLTTYLGAALGLLLITSFLSLRRYLRQRRIAMPATVVTAWVTVGIMIALTMLVVAAILPRPSPEYTIADVAQRLGIESSSSRAPSDAPSASAAAVGGEGTPDDQATNARGENSDPAAPPPGDGRQPAPPQRGANDEPQLATTPNEQPPDERSEAERQSAGRATPADERPPRPSDADAGRSSSTPREPADRASPPRNSAPQQQPSGASTAQPNKTQPNQTAGQAAQPDRATKPDNPTEPNKPTAPNQPPEPDRRAADQSAEPRDAAEQADAPNESSAAAEPPELEPPVAAIGGWLEWAVWCVYGAVGLAAVYAAWRFRHGALEALRSFLASWRDFWLALFGRGEADDDGDDAPAARRPRPFASFVDPFQSGAAAQWPAQKLVRYSFAALEAWASEHDLARLPEQTPSEFVRRLGLRAPTLARPAQQLADAYNRTAYARDSAPLPAVAPLRNFWQAIHACVVTPVEPPRFGAAGAQAASRGD